jgi:hypothetical protein
MVSLRTASPSADGVRPGLDLDIRLVPPPPASGRPEQTAVGYVLVGGSGKHVGEEMYLQCDGRLPDKTFLAAFDSDPDPCRLPPETVVTLTVPGADLLVERRENWPSIDKALPAGYKAGRVFRGSMLKRPVTACLVLPFHARRLRQELAARFVVPMLSVTGHGDTRLRGGRCRVVLHLIGSLGGGFGSATKDLLPALLRDLFREVHEGIIVEIIWHVFTSNVHRGVLPMEWQGSRADANAFAALLEFEAGFHDPARVPWELLGVQPFSRPLIDQVRVYDLANEQGEVLDVSDVYSMVATTLLTQSLAVLSDTLGRDDANDGVDAGLSPQENASAPYGSTTAHRLIFPAEKVARFVVLDGLRRVAQVAWAAPRLPGPDRDRLAREHFQTSGLPGLAARLAAALPLPVPEVATPAGAEEWETAPAALLQARHDHDARVAALEPRAVELVEACVADMVRAVHCSFQEMLALPSRHTPHDVAAVFDEVLAGANRLLSEAQAGLARLDLPALGERFERALAGLREAQVRPAWFKRRKLRLAHLQAANDLAAYARAGHRALLLRTAVAALGRVREALTRLPDRARQSAQAGQAALRALEVRAREARDRIGQHQIFVREAVDAAWAEERVAEFFAGTDWARWADELFGPALVRLRTPEEVEEFLNDAAACAVEEVVRPKLAGFHVASEEMLGQAAAWLREVADRAAPQFSYDPVKCGEQCQTYFAQLLAVGSRAAADRLLKECKNVKAEVVVTGDPHQIVYTAHRRLVPLCGAINNLPSLERAYRYWVARAAADPQAEVHSNRAYAEMDKEGLIAQMCGRAGA